MLLLHQFHDILPGSSIAQVYVEANQAHAALQQEAGALAAAAREVLVTPGEGVTVFNALGFARTEVVALPQGFDGAVTAGGEPVPAVQGKALVTVPALGAVSLRPAAASPAASLARVERKAKASCSPRRDSGSAWMHRAG